ncbi:MAG: dihydrolipoyl dehydrogenase [Deltaproteobacteria bacterium CG11_big_fil_rev_8_21_14_0_20_42_23]|nr:MAG: dihydrolipoyl dehydrogenase [Deltaproteobacteria bacterium CG11_big_fil_rev_8_21_14_0_20_42_23]PJC64507.1 MAG: dihydrolipoyl dehydrogenase [Deltaproteobacteria bacterium CG_4_9_14_0_2_um_filter_42_21]
MSQHTFDLIVIGAGPGGYVAAIRAAQLGMNVACVEKQYLGGTCLNVGCIPSKALLESSELYETAVHKAKDHGISIEKVSIDFKKMIERKDRVVKQLTSGVGGLFKKNKVTHFSGTAKILGTGKVEVDQAGEKTELQASNIIIATGSAPIQIPSLPFGDRIISSTEALALTEIPESLIVVGGGYIGLEMGSVYMRLGTKVTVVEALDRLTPGMDSDISKALQRVLSKQGMTFMLSTKVKSAKAKKNEVEVSVEDANGEVSSLNASYVLVSVGRKPYTDGLGLDEAGIERDEKGRIKVDGNWKTNLEGVYAVGDVIDGPMLAHKASEEGVALVEQLAGHHTQMNYNTIPAAVYTWPEAACVGITEEQAKEQGIDYKTAKFPFMANGRAISMGEKDGFVKLIADKTTDRLIGAHIIGPRASDMIAELTLGMEFGVTGEDIALTIHAHPTLAESVKEAALGLGSGMIHM